MLKYHQIGWQPRRIGRKHHETGSKTTKSIKNKLNQPKNLQHGWNITKPDKKQGKLTEISTNQTKNN